MSIYVPSHKTNSYAGICGTGYWFILPTFLVAVAAYFLFGKWTALPIFVLCALFLFYFRDPKRAWPGGDFVAPIDGTVVAVCEVEYPKFFTGRATRISVVNSVLDTHVTRSPSGGRVMDVSFLPGKPGQNVFHTKTHNGMSIVFAQCAGLMNLGAVRSLRKFEVVNTGARIGLIQPGSRFDVYLPLSVIVRVEKGERVRGAESILGNEFLIRGGGYVDLTLKQMIDKSNLIVIGKIKTGFPSGSPFLCEVEESLFPRRQLGIRQTIQIQLSVEVENCRYVPSSKAENARRKDDFVILFLKTKGSQIEFVCKESFESVDKRTEVEHMKPGPI